MTLDQARLYRLGVVLVTASAIIWSTAGLFTRMIDADTATMLFWRGVFGAIGIALFMLIRDRGGALNSVRRIGWAGWLYAVISAAGMLCFIASLRMTSVAHVAIIYAAVPFIAGGLAWLIMGEKMTAGAVMASLAALAGVAIMVGLGLGEGSLLGDGLALLMTISMAVIMIMSRYFRAVPMLAAAGLSALLSALAVLPIADVFAVSGTDMITLAAFGMVNSGLGLALFTIGSRFLPPAETGLIGALDAPLSPLWVWIIFAETPTSATLIGGAIVFAAVLMHLLSSLQADKTIAAMGS